MYSDFMREYRELGHMSLIKKYSWPHYFLPHHGVFREDSTTTKLRVVFDASCVTTTNKSLNDIQYTGASLQNDIPKLELCAALIGARLYKKIINSLRLQINCSYFWTDSTIVMGWLRMSPHLLKPFVQNRVIEINELTGDLLWLHIDGNNNPADLVSRGLYIDALKDNRLWWDGPSFLHCNEWLNKQNVSISNDLPELKNKTINTVCINSEIIIDFTRFSTFNKLKRTGAYVLRFIHNIRSKQQRKTGSLTADELTSSVQVLSRIAQMHSFPSLYNSLVNAIPIKSCKEMNKVLGLNVFLDNNKLIRVGGRLNNSNFTYNKIHPILLCNPADYSPLTPAHFLIGRPLTAPACHDFTNTQSSQLIRYNRVEQMRQHFWRRWSTEYVTQLQNRIKWKENKGDIKLGTLILVKEDNQPPLKWRLGRIIRVYPGKDGISRVADIRTATGQIQRAFTKICPLPLSTDENKSSAPTTSSTTYTTNSDN
ncbi:uncharacterized protein LOC131851106 [Achroia grisella]|uniref:uncharacterized protein LOC131851106 n=1 Tax=Achroia grisella TaxID=688607 RepID=UPI0027D27F87|nr:uncharacterized protein LOC131851106 [Achroia grisella]